MDAWSELTQTDSSQLQDAIAVELKGHKIWYNLGTLQGQVVADQSNRPMAIEMGMRTQ